MYSASRVGLTAPYSRVTSLTFIIKGAFVTVINPFWSLTVRLLLASPSDVRLTLMSYVLTFAFLSAPSLVKVT